MTLNEKIEELCQAKGLHFKPWEMPPPWEIETGEACPYPPHSAAAYWWPKCQALRAKLIEELGE